jgi:hypothetical protein
MTGRRGAAVAVRMSFLPLTGKAENEFRSSVRRSARAINRRHRMKTLTSAQ